MNTLETFIPLFRAELAEVLKWIGEPELMPDGFRLPPPFVVEATRSEFAATVEIEVWRETPWGIYGCTCHVEMAVIDREGADQVALMTALHMAEKLNNVTEKDFNAR